MRNTNNDSIPRQNSADALCSLRTLLEQVLLGLLLFVSVEGSWVQPNDEKKAEKS